MSSTPLLHLNNCNVNRPHTPKSMPSTICWPKASSRTVYCNSTDSVLGYFRNVWTCLRPALPGRWHAFLPSHLAPVRCSSCPVVVAWYSSLFTESVFHFRPGALAIWWANYVVALIYTYKISFIIYVYTPMSIHTTVFSSVSLCQLN